MQVVQSWRQSSAYSYLQRFLFVPSLNDQINKEFHEIDYNNVKILVKVINDNLNLYIRKRVRMITHQIATDLYTHIQ